MRYGGATAIGAMVSMAWITAALADGPVAVVEDVTGKPGVEFMDYVDAGKVIKLGPRDVLVLSYLKSCSRETITGGTVTVGTEQSAVQGGNVERAKVKCNGGSIALSPEQAVQSAGVITRSVRTPSGETKNVPAPQFTLFARIPIVDVRDGGTLVIERLDEAENRVEIPIQPAQLVRGAFLDFARVNRVLTAGGIYRATLGARQVVFRVDAAAPPMAPVVSRLVRF